MIIKRASCFIIMQNEVTHHVFCMLQYGGYTMHVRAVHTHICIYVVASCSYSHSYDVALFTYLNIPYLCYVMLLRKYKYVVYVMMFLTSCHLRYIMSTIAYIKYYHVTLGDIFKIYTI